MRIVAGVCLAALVLAACGKPADKTDVAAADAPAAKSEKPIPPGIDAAPQLKAGLWEITNANLGGARLRTCVDKNSQADSAALGQGIDRRDCTKSDWKRIPNGISFDFACNAKGRQVTNKGTVTGDFNTAYRMEAEATMTSNGQTMSSKHVVEAKYVGACPEGLKPGQAQVNFNGQWISGPPNPAG